MSIWLGGDEADAIYLGADPVDAVYLGEDRVWPIASGVEFIGSTYASATTVTPPAHQAGDLLIFYAGNSSAFGSLPALPAGKTNLRNGGTFGAAVRVAYMYATSSGEVSGTWTGATALHCSVYRNAVIGVNGWGAPSTSWPALSGFSTDAWIYRAAYAAYNTLTMPTGFTDRGGMTSGFTKARTGDTAGPYGATSIAAATISPATNTYGITLAIEPA